MILPVQFPPLKDEMPISWLKRLAFANAFDNLKDLLKAYDEKNGYTYNVNSSGSYWENILEEFIDTSWVKKYRNYIAKNRILLPDIATKSIKVCPQCMSEELHEYGNLSYHFQHQYIGCHTCWKHGCNLSKIDVDEYFKLKYKVRLKQINGDYDTEKEKHIISLIEQPNRLFFEMVKYRMEMILKFQKKTPEDINNFSDIKYISNNHFRFDDTPETMFYILKGIENETPIEEVCKSDIIMNLFFDHQKYIHFLWRLDENIIPPHIDLIKMYQEKFASLRKAQNDHKI